MNKQIAGSTEKKSSFFRRSSLNATPVSTQRASTANSATSASSTKTHRHEVSFGLPMENASAAKDEPVATKASPCATSRPAADDDCPASLVVTSLPDSEEFPPPPPPPPPPQVPTICTSYSHGLSTISERHSMEDDSLLRPIEGEGSRTNSSCSMPDYLCHKLHSVKVNVQPVAVSSGESQPHSKPTRNALDPRLSIAPSTLAGSSSISRLVKESCDSSTSTTTSESYQLSDLPPLPAKLATLSKPSAQSVLASALRSRKARHSIDVRALPSYLARKRQSTFGQFLTALSPTAPEESSSSDGSSLFSEPVAPTLSLGERVAWVKSSGPEFGVVKWIGRMPQITNDWTVGVEFDNAIGSGDGTVEGRRYFVAKENFAKFLPLSDLTKVDNYAGRPRSGTMLSRMSVQLKPGQLISIQRSPTTNVPHCYLNAPHHVGHDVHSPNNRHCQCPSCNHPCAHICKTRKPKGKRWTEDMAHMCHFSSKPHAHMCCGGEDLPSAAQPIIEPGVSWRHSEVIASLRTVPTEYNPRRKSINMHQADGGLKKSPRQPEVASPSFMRENIAPSNCSSALLERTGSDLSISSLPSSSSVAEVYIGRSVLTDESDIDSETERSLESNSKVGNSKQGLRSLVACFIANSLRLKKPEKEKKETTKSGRSHGGKRVKKSTRSEKDRFRSKQPRPLGLSSTDGSSYADIPSSALNSQPLPSLSLDASRHANIEPISRPAVLFSSPRFASSSNHVRNTYTKSSSKSSPYRKVDTFGQHHIDGHISEEVITNTSSNSSAPRMSSADRADSSNRPSTNASSENAASPRRRRNKGPAPKPPITAQCSSSPLSTTNNTNTSCPSSVPQSPTNSSVVTSLSASSKNQVVLTKSPAPLPPHLTRSLSEQKQLNMKNLINATHTFRSEVNLQDLTTTQSEGENSLPDELLHLRDNEENIVLVCEESFPTELLAKKSEQKQHHHRHHHHHHQKAPTDSKRIAQMLIRDAEDAIYQTPLPVKTLLTEEMPPDLPSKTFDPVKVFGCKLNGETKRLERTADSECSGSPSMPRSLSMPCSQFTCCMYHWKEYLNVLSKTDHLKLNHKEDSPKQPASNCKQAKSGVTCEHDKFAPLISEECDCESDHYHECAVPSDLMNALLSPQHSLRYRKHSSKDSSKKHSPEHASSTNADLSVAFGSFERCEFIRALSDGSLTNTSTATVVEFINDDSSNGDSQTKREVPEQFSSKGSNTLKQGNAGGGGDLLLLNSPKCLSDVFCQTNFEETPERPVRRYRNHKYSCRCRHLKARSHGQNRHCRHRHCAHHDCCPSAPAAACFGGGEDMRATSRNVWLTSSTSDHSLSSLSSSTSTLSEASTMRTSSTLSSEVANCKVPHLCTFGEPILSRFPDTDVGFYSNAETLTEMMLSGRSPISTERLFKSAENNFPPPLVEPESTTEFDAFDQLHLKSSSTPSGNVFQELNADMFLNTTTLSIPCKPNNSNDKSLVEESQNKCLMSELEMAIACGNHQRAAILAKELAIKRANCSLSAKFSNTSIKDKPVRTSPIVAYLYIEDRNTHKGPIPFQVYPSMSVNMLKLKVEKEFNIPSELQKWVLGRNIATNLSAALSTYGITNSGCPIFLYVLSAAQPATSNNTISATLNNKPSLVSEMTKTNGNLSSDDDNIYESLRAPPAVLMPLTQYDEKCGQSLNSSSNTLSRKAPTGKSLLSKEAGNGSGQLNSLASFGGSSSSTSSVAYFAGDSNVMTGTNNAQLVCSDAAEFAPTTSLSNNQHLVKNYYYQEGEVPFGNQLVFEGLGIVNELLPRLDEEDEDDLEEEEDEITAKNVNGISELALATLNEVTTAAVSTYQKLVELEDVKCVRNVEPFECPICFGRFKPGEGVVLRECLHTFCRDCLKGTIEYNEEVQVKCPFRDDLYSCDCALQDREIKELASSETYERYLKKSVSVAEKNLDKSFHCKNADCAGWCIYDDTVNFFKCPVCAKLNCITCQAIHEGSNCKQYQEELEFNSATDEEAKKTKQFFEDMLKREEALRCPQCKILVLKKWGCDWVKCSMCDTEICWVTKGFRWGPKGKGDLSGGCKCMVNGIRCHVNCKYCH